MAEIHTIVTKNSRRAYTPYYFMFACVLLVCVYLTLLGQLVLPALGAAAIIVFLGINITELHRLWEGYEVNPSAVIHTHGLISKKSRRIDLFAINTVSVHQTLFQRILNIGDIHVHVANASHVTTLKNLQSPKVFAQTIQNNMHKIRNVYKNPETNTHSNTRDLFKQPPGDDFVDNTEMPDPAETSDSLQEI